MVLTMDNNHNNDIAPTMEIGASDRVLLSVSIAGLIIIGTAIYLLLPKAPPTVAVGEPRVVGGELLLGEEDETGGNRAQRRARARRRAAPVNNVNQAVNNDGRAEEIQEENGVEHAEAHDDEVEVVMMTRKERAKALKRAQKEERRRYEEQRREELRRKKEADEAAYLHRKEKEKQEDEKQRQLLRKQENDLAEKQQREHIFWTSQFTHHSAGDDSLNCSSYLHEKIIAVVNKNKKISTHALRSQFGLSHQQIVRELEVLLSHKKIRGVFADDSCFISLTVHEMDNVVRHIETNGKITADVFSKEAGDLIGIKMK